MDNTKEDKDQNNNNKKNNNQQTNTKESTKAQEKSENTQKTLSKGKRLPPIMTLTSNNNFRHQIYYKTTTSIGHQLNNSASKKNSIMEEDIDSLKQELVLNRMEMNKKKKELNELKIALSKLNEDNRNNKLLIGNILGINVENAITKKELFETIINCKPSDEQKKQLQDAYEIIKLKLQISGKKKILNNKKLEISNLTKNAKTKIIKELGNEYHAKCVHEKKIVKEIKKMEETKKKKRKSCVRI